MSYETFRTAIITAAPDLILDEDEDLDFDAPAPPGLTRVSFLLAPAENGPRLTIRIGEAEFAINVADEQQAAAIIARLFDLAS